MLLQNTTESGRRAHTIAETCALTGLGRDTVYAAIRSGRLLARKIGRRTLVTDDDLRQFLAGLPRAGGFDQVMSDCPVATINPPAPRPPPAPRRTLNTNAAPVRGGVALFTQLAGFAALRSSKPFVSRVRVPPTPPS